MGDVFRAFKVAKKETKAQRAGESIAALVAARIPFDSRNFGTVLLLREPGRAVVDFYPSTGRWRTPHNNKTMSGGVDAFLAWYAKR